MKQDEYGKTIANQADATRSMTPASAALYRILGSSPQPRMLTLHEIELLKQSAKEIALVTRALLAGIEKA